MQISLWAGRKLSGGSWKRNRDFPGAVVGEDSCKIRKNIIMSKSIRVFQAERYPPCRGKQQFCAADHFQSVHKRYRSIFPPNRKRV